MKKSLVAIAVLFLMPLTSLADEPVTPENAPGPFSRYYKKLSDFNMKADGYIYGFRHRFLSTAMAKEICSCHFISGVDSETCQTQFPHIPKTFWNFVKIKVNDEARTVTVVPRVSIVGFTYFQKVATFTDQGEIYGCHVE